MISNTLKKKWANGQATLNGWLSIGNSFTSEIMAEQGYDSLTVDIQHGFLDYNDSLDNFINCVYISKYNYFINQKL